MNDIGEEDVFNYTKMDHIAKFFWIVEKDTHPLTMGMILLIDKDISLEDVAVNYQPFLHNETYKRFLQVGMEKNGRFYWCDYPAFNIFEHLEEHFLPAPGGDTELHQMASALFSRPLDRSLPLWKTHVIHGLQGGAAAVLFRVHHAVSDGQGCIRAILSVVHEQENCDRSSLQYTTKKRQATHASGKVEQGWLTKGAYALAAIFISFLSVFYQIYIYLADTLRGLFRTKTSFDYPAENIPYPKDIAWSQLIPLSHIKTIKNAFGCTVNDVVLSSVVQALRTYLVQNDQPIQEFFWSIPISLRMPDDWSMRNASTMMYAYMPSKIDDRIECLRETQQRVSYLKSSLTAHLNYGSMWFIMRIPYIKRIMLSFNRRPFDWIGSRPTCLLSNVPGPQQPLVLGGNEIKSIIPLLPMHGRGVLSIAVLSYNGNVSFVIQAEKNQIIGGAYIIAEEFNNEIDELYKLALKKLASEKPKDD